MLNIPADYPTRWYVLDAVAEALEHVNASTPKPEIERIKTRVVRDFFRAENGYKGPLAVFA